ncbi:SGNH/GDSL hydrolase family protein [Variovorax sp. J22P271]|uniref:SGNH/GDSL hydrolase family protein n=1 Tax=Variovorax davisae TaxID=3053515 RepID=UPI002577F257|nr:SGNH/GDSL hydrolase family protein [Variovorax sp. J22P271]MDM0033106.1 SGNH/GDSL hydrolase family protein [Variovorax sp. J22P271]
MKLFSRRRALLRVGALLAATQAPAPSWAADAGVVVAFGDSITAGAGAMEEPGRPVRYPDRLAARLQARPGDAGPRTVVNAGISGNRLLADGVGTKGIARFAQDVLGQRDLTHVVILIGINDIGFSMPEGAAGPIRGQPAAEDITAGLEQLIQQARARGVKVLLGTLLPFKGSSYWSKEKESRRDAVNRWIRSRRHVEAVVDFDATMRDPTDPQVLKAAYDSGDHLHPGNAGYAAMADAIDLRALRK